MDTRQLEHLLYRHRATQHQFGGILARDQLPVRAAHKCYVINTDTRLEPGSHWVAIYFDQRGGGEYFDSYGIPPVFPEIRTFLDRNSVKWSYNNKRLQSARTAVCGQYCAYFLIARSSQQTMSRIVSPFSETNFRANDVHVRSCINKLLKVYLPFYQD